MSIRSQNPVINNFNRAAMSYDDAAVVQCEIADRLIENLDIINLKPQKILDLGAGTGYATRLLAKRYPEAEIVAVDSAAKMLGHLAKLPVTAICADAAELPLESQSVDLVFSSLMLHWSEDVERVLSEIRRVLRPGGLLLFSTLGPDTMQELRSAWAAVDDAPHVHYFLDMHDVGDLLLRAGLRDPVMDRDDITMQYGSVASFLRDLKSLGVQNAHDERRRGLLGKKRYAAFLSAYEAFKSGQHYPVTYEVLYGHAWGVEQKTGQGEREVSIPVSEITINTVRE